MNISSAPTKLLPLSEDLKKLPRKRQKEAQFKAILLTALVNEYLRSYDRVIENS